MKTLLVRKTPTFSSFSPINTIFSMFLQTGPIFIRLQTIPLFQRIKRPPLMPFSKTPPTERPTAFLYLINNAQTAFAISPFSLCISFRTNRQSILPKRAATFITSVKKLPPFVGKLVVSIKNIETATPCLISSIITSTHSYTFITIRSLINRPVMLSSP